MVNQLLLVQGMQWCNISYSLVLTFHFSEANPPSEEECKYFMGWIVTRLPQKEDEVGRKYIIIVNDR